MQRPEHGSDDDCGPGEEGERDGHARARRRISRRELEAIATAIDDLRHDDPEVAELLTIALSAQAQTDPALAAAAKEPGAVVKPSGLVFLSLRDGSGARPGPTDTRNPAATPATPRTARVAG